MNPSFLPAVVDREIGGVVVPTVDARQLHAALRVGTDFRHWILRRIARAALVEGRDYAKGDPVSFDRTPGRSDRTPREGDSNDPRSIEYVLTIPSAKQVLLLERGSTATAIRSHFIRCEERLRDVDPAAHAESRERMREDIRAAQGAADQPGAPAGGARVNPGDGDPSLVGRLVDELLAMGAEARG